MGFLENVGRSGGVGQLGQTIFQDVLAAGDFKQRAEMRDMQIKKEQQNIEAFQKEQEELHKPQNIRTSVLYLSLPEEKREEFANAFIQSGYADPDGTTSLFKRNKFIAENKHGMDLYFQARKEKAALTVDKAYQGLEAAQLANDPEKLAKAQAAFQTAVAQAAALDGHYKEVMGMYGKENKTNIIPAGGKMVDSTGKVLADNPKQTDEEMTQLRRDQLTETQRHNREMEGLTKQKQQANDNLTFADKEALRSMGKQLPKSKVAAETAAKNVQKIDRMIALINQNAGGVKGELIARINKVADLMRRTPPEDAKYNTLKAELRGFAGQLRMQLGFVGATSDRDVAIMYEAAGGGTPAESQRAILEGYRQGYMQDINNYNSDAQAYSGYSKAGSNIFRPIEVPGATQQDVVPPDLPEGTVSNGDGTFTLPNGKRVRKQ